LYINDCAAWPLLGGENSCKYSENIHTYSHKFLHTMEFPAEIGAL